MQTSFICESPPVPVYERGGPHRFRGPTRPTSPVGVVLEEVFEARADHQYWSLSEADREAVELTDSGEELVGVMRALLGLAPLKTNVNVPNRGQAPDLERGALVETNALLTEDATTPLTAQPLPDPVRTLVERHVTNQETLVAAGFAGDLDLVFQAFCNDPLVAADRGLPRNCSRNWSTPSARTCRATTSPVPRCSTVPIWMRSLAVGPAANARLRSPLWNATAKLTLVIHK